MNLILQAIKSLIRKVENAVSQTVTEIGKLKKQLTTLTTDLSSVRMTAQDAKTAANDARNTAVTAQVTAEGAQATAETAQNAANTAKTTAENAKIPVVHITGSGYKGNGVLNGITEYTEGMLITAIFDNALEINVLRVHIRLNELDYVPLATRTFDSSTTKSDQVPFVKKGDVMLLQYANARFNVLGYYNNQFNASTSVESCYDNADVVDKTVFGYKWGCRDEPYNVFVRFTYGNTAENPRLMVGANNLSIVDVDGNPIAPDAIKTDRMHHFVRHNGKWYMMQ